MQSIVELHLEVLELQLLLKGVVLRDQDSLLELIGQLRVGVDCRV